MRFELIRNQASVGIVARDRRGKVIAAAGATDMPAALRELIFSGGPRLARALARGVVDALRDREEE